MVSQGDIIWLDFNPQSGHEQGGRRPGLVVSKNNFNHGSNVHMVCPISKELLYFDQPNQSNVHMVCPISRADKGYLYHIRLDGRTSTIGVIMCDQAKSMDIRSRRHAYIERLPADILSEVLHLIKDIFEMDPPSPPPAA
jgi:mRNA interferase MazF